MKMTLTHPPPERRKEYNTRILNEARELRRARTLVEAGKALNLLDYLISKAADTYGIKLNRLPGFTEQEVRAGLIKQAAGNKKLLDARMPGRARSNELKSLILEFAKDWDLFTIDDILHHNPKLVCSRASLVANLHVLASKGEKPLELVKKGHRGRKGMPSLYRLRSSDNKT